MTARPLRRYARILPVVAVGLVVLAVTVRSQTRPEARRALTAVAIEEVRLRPGEAELRLSPTPDAPQTVLRVDPRGGGDVTTVAEALRRVTAGEIALAAGTYELDPTTIPAGVSLAGGFDPQTWRYDPVRNRTVLAPKDRASDRPLLRLAAGTRLSGLVVRDARVGIELAGDGVVLQGVGVSHCAQGVIARAEARGLITYATFVHNATALSLEAGTEVAVQNSIFQRNGLGVAQL